MRNIYFVVVLLLAFSLSALSQSKRSTDSGLSKLKSQTSYIKEVKISKDTTWWIFRSTDNLVTLIGYILVAIASYLTYKQWRSDQAWKEADQEWKRKEVLMNRVSSFDATPGVWNALLMLASPDRDIALWDKEKPENKYERVTRRQVATALLPHEFLSISYCPKETAIRDSFDDFFKRLSHLEIYRESKLLNEDEINSAIHQWADTIRKLVASSNLDDQALLRNLSLYIHCKELTKVISLFNALCIPLESEIEKYKEIVLQEVEDKKWRRLPNKKLNRY